MTYQPTDAQVEAAFLTIHGRKNKYIVGPPEMLDEMREEVRHALIAAHAAAEPVDTTEFEAAAQKLIDVCTDGDDEFTVADGEIVSRIDEAEAVLFALYVKAATR